MHLDTRGQSSNVRHKLRPKVTYLNELRKSEGTNYLQVI